MAANGSLGRLKAKVRASLDRRRSRGRSSPATTSTTTTTTTAPVGPPVTSPAGPPVVVEPDRSATGGIAVSYAPERDGDADPGEVVWSWVPFEEDPMQGKDRPVLVVGWDGPLLAAVQLSSKDHADRRDAGDWIEVGRGAWDREGRVSYADASRLLRLDPSGVRREGAALDRERFDVVLARVRVLHAWTG